MKNNKPLGGKAYGSIPHLPGSRRGPADIGLSESQAAILTTRKRDRHDLIIVQEKLDGSNCSVAKIDGEILAVTRAGYLASTSPFPQHHRFAEWVSENAGRFNALLGEGERVVGEWLWQAHGTRYDLPHEPFVIFDLFTGKTRSPFCELELRCKGFVLPRLIHMGGPFSIEDAIKAVATSGHGAIDPVEGAVWRVERLGAVDFLGKFVRHEKKDGCFLPEVSGRPEVLNSFPGCKR
jgi:hypothetical protein